MGPVATSLAALDCAVEVDIVDESGLAVDAPLEVARGVVLDKFAVPVSVSNTRVDTLVVAVFGDEVVVNVVDTAM